MKTSDLKVDTRTHMIRYSSWGSATYTPVTVVKVTPSGLIDVVPDGERPYVYRFRADGTELQATAPDGHVIKAGKYHGHCLDMMMPFEKRLLFLERLERAKVAAQRVNDIAVFEHVKHTYDPKEMHRILDGIQERVAAAVTAVNAIGPEVTEENV